MEMKRSSLAFMLIVLGVVWGLTIPLTKIAVSTGHKPPGLIFWQLVVVTLLLSVVAFMRRTGPVFDSRHLRYFAMLGLLGTILPNSISYLAVAHLPAGVMGIVIASVPMFTLGIDLGINSERPSYRRVLGVCLGAAAVVLLIGPQASLPEPEQAFYVLVALVAPLCYGLEGNYIASRSPPQADPVATLLGASAIGTVMALPIALATGSWVNPLLPWGAAEWALVISSALHALAYTGYIWLVGVAGAVFSSQIAYVVTVSAVFLSALILRESYSGWVWSALVLMIAGLALVQPRPATQSLQNPLVESGSGSI